MGPKVSDLHIKKKTNQVPDIQTAVANPQQHSKYWRVNKNKSMISQWPLGLRALPTHKNRVLN